MCGARARLVGPGEVARPTERQARALNDPSGLNLVERQRPHHWLRRIERRPLASGFGFSSSSASLGRSRNALLKALAPTQRHAGHVGVGGLLFQEQGASCPPRAAPRRGSECLHQPGMP